MFQGKHEMSMQIVLLAIYSLLLFVVHTTNAYEIRWFDQKLDHFDTVVRNATWKQRYVVNTENFVSGGPLFFYTGNEGDIEGFYSSNGFLIDVLAPKFGALVVFAEERYYGVSLPFGNATFDGGIETLKYLSTDNVLADYANLIQYLKANTPGLNEDTRVVAFGGSYGGTLATFMRVRYPNVVTGSLAASAPVLYYDPHGWKTHGDVIDSYTWADITANAFQECMPIIRYAIGVIESAAIEDLVDVFRLCEPSGLGPTSKSDLFVYALESMPQLNYPPEWPVHHTCEMLSNADDDDILSVAANITLNALGFDPTKAKCMPTLSEGPGSIPGDGPGGISAWSFQSCVETIHEFSSSASKRGHLRDYTFDINRSNRQCRDLFGIEPDVERLTRSFGGYEISQNAAGVSNIIWSNGGFDPWHGGGFYPNPRSPLPNASTPLYREDATRGLHYIWIQRGAHHGDLRAPTSSDPDELTRARAIEMEIIGQWVSESSGGSLPGLK
eukprot:g1552.t1